MDTCYTNTATSASGHLDPFVARRTTKARTTDSHHGDCVEADKGCSQGCKCIAETASHKGRSKNLVVLQAVQGVKDVETTTPKRAVNAWTTSRPEKLRQRLVPLGGAEMMADSNITVQPRDGSQQRRRITSQQPMSASATPMSVEPSTRTTRQAVDHFAGDDKRASMIAGLFVFCEESTEDWQYISGLETLGEPEPSTFAVLVPFF